MLWRIFNWLELPTQRKEHRIAALFSKYSSTYFQYNKLYINWVTFVNCHVTHHDESLFKIDNERNLCVWVMIMQIYGDVVIGILVLVVEVKVVTEKENKSYIPLSVKHNIGQFNNLFILGKNVTIILWRRQKVIVPVH